jgi:iron(III) transport system substrate-binding protein
MSRNRVRRASKFFREIGRAVRLSSPRTRGSSASINWIPAFAGMTLLVNVSPALADWKDQPAVKALYEAAKTEKTVMVWGPQRAEVDWIPAAFAKAFPGVDVQFLGDNDVATKAIAEARGGRNEVDVMWNSLTVTLTLSQRDLLAKTDWSMFGIDPAATGFDGKMAYSNKVAYSIAYNKETVAATDVPKNWDEATQPKYRGKMVASLFLLPRLLGGLSLSWGLDKTTAFAREILASSDLMLTKAPRETFVLSGERAIAYGEIDTLFRRQIRDGKPFGLALPEPIVMAQFGPSVMAKAPHPSAAKLLAGWLSTPDGRRARKEATAQIDYDAGSDDEIAKKIAAGQVKIVLDTLDDMAKREDAIRKLGPLVAGQAQ